jgi:hypothetical protein
MNWCRLHRIRRDNAKAILTTKEQAVLGTFDLQGSEGSVWIRFQPKVAIYLRHH